MLVRREVFERVGGFDERFFMYYEEVDLCKRIRDGFGRVVYYPGAEIIHLGGKSSGQIPARKRLMMLNSLLRYLKKHTYKRRSWILSILFKAGVTMQFIGEGLAFSVMNGVYGVIRNRQKMSRYAGRRKATMEFLLHYTLRFWREQE